MRGYWELIGQLISAKTTFPHIFPVASPLHITYTFTDLPTHPQMYTLCKCLRQSEIISNRQNSYSRKHKHIMKVQCRHTWLFIVANTDATFLKSKHVLLMLELNIHVYIHSVVFGGRNRTWKNPTCVTSWSILSKHVLLNLLYIHIYSVVFGGMNWTWKSTTCCILKHLE